MLSSHMTCVHVNPPTVIIPRPIVPGPYFPYPGQPVPHNSLEGFEPQAPGQYCSTQDVQDSQPYFVHTCCGVVIVLAMLVWASQDPWALQAMSLGKSPGGMGGHVFRLAHSQQEWGSLGLVTPESPRVLWLQNHGHKPGPVWSGRILGACSVSSLFLGRLKETRPWLASNLQQSFCLCLQGAAMTDVWPLCPALRLPSVTCGLGWMCSIETT